MRSEALKKAQKKYYDKKKEDESYVQNRNDNMRLYYDSKKEDPDFREKINKRSLDYYYRNRESILEKKK